MPNPLDSIDTSPGGRGVDTILEVVKTLPPRPGVYRMINNQGDVLYIGKAKDLSKRVRSYTHIDKLPTRLKRMVHETVAMEIIVTQSEGEALLLEARLIKKLQPRYNVLLKDDKSFAYIVIRKDHPYPQLIKHRGAQSIKGDYFGPFASTQAVNTTIYALQKAFKLRTCKDSYFAARTRPCLQYHIKRCSAPCVDKISDTDYMATVHEAQDVLNGQMASVQKGLVEQMHQASDHLDYESAAIYRDRLSALAHIQITKDLNLGDIQNADAIALAHAGGMVCVQVFFVRHGCNYGNRAYYLSHTQHYSPEDILGSFLGQFYEQHPPPRQIFIHTHATDERLISQALSERYQYTVHINVPKRGPKRVLVDYALRNAEEALARKTAESASQKKLLEGVADAFGLATPPNRIEVYDNSHIQGKHAYGAMIVAGPDGFDKKSYRKFTIKSLPDIGDDYGMLKEVFQRRFKKNIKDDKWLQPDLVMIDGGKGQLSTAMAVMEECGLSSIPLVAIAKGPDRNAGRERFFMPDGREFSLDVNDPVLFYLQRLRDEAHRFAIGTHRAKRIRAIDESGLNAVPGIGPKRKKALLHHFGSLHHIKMASIKDLESVEGISDTMARIIYQAFHPYDNT